LEAVGKDFFQKTIFFLFAERVVGGARQRFLFKKKIRFLFADRCLLGARQRNFSKKNILLFAERRVKTLGKEGVTVHNGHAVTFLCRRPLWR